MRTLTKSALGVNFFATLQDYLKQIKESDNPEELKVLYSQFEKHLDFKFLLEDESDITTLRAEFNKSGGK